MLLIFTGLRRRARCGECEACKRQDCGKCVNCLDKKKFSGQGRKKQCCVERKCKTMLSVNKGPLPEVKDAPLQQDTYETVDPGRYMYMLCIIFT